MSFERKVRAVKVGGLTLDGEKKYIQSMLCVPAENISGNVEQAIRLEEAGCDILRVAIPNKKSLELIPEIKSAIKIPLVADIHFDYKLAVAAAQLGIDKIRINPGNIGEIANVKAVIRACKNRNIPIRIGVNSGSLERDILEKHGKPTAEALVESALRHAEILTANDFYDIVISIKSSDVATMMKSYRLLAEKCDFPLHLGVTEAGTTKIGTLKSAIGIGSLLADNIGETFRVSLTADPVEQIYAAKDILKSLGMGSGVNIISCPTCGRTKIDLFSLTNAVENAVADIKKDITVAVMGCVVNGPGEAREADLGIAGGDGCGIIFKRGEVLKKVREDELLSELLLEIEKY